ncbi:MAG TPA: hypothetical protein VHF26_02795, partial [Trebonia sp.]|nr:hypothetical protein [Trebonia sp.]
MQPDDQPTPESVLAGLLLEQPEAAPLLGEARHRRALADGSAADAEFRFRELQAARLRYEQLRRRDDPRHRLPVDFAAGLLALLVFGAGLAVLNFVELSGLLSGLAAL